VKETPKRRAGVKIRPDTAEDFGKGSAAVLALHSTHDPRRSPDPRVVLCSTVHAPLPLAGDARYAGATET